MQFKGMPTSALSFSIYVLKITTSQFTNYSSEQMRVLCSNAENVLTVLHYVSSLRKPINDYNNNDNVPFAVAVCSCRHSLYLVWFQDRPHQFWWEWPLEESLPGEQKTLMWTHYSWHLSKLSTAAVLFEDGNYNRGECLMLKWIWM